MLICSFSKEFLRDYYILASVLGAGNSTKSKTGQDSCPPGVYRPTGWRCWGDTKIFRGYQERLHCRWWPILFGGLILLRFGRWASEDGGLGHGSFNMIFTCFVLNQWHLGLSPKAPLGWSCSNDPSQIVWKSQEDEHTGRCPQFKSELRNNPPVTLTPDAVGCGRLLVARLCSGPWGTFIWVTATGRCLFFGVMTSLWGLSWHLTPRV